MILLKRIVVTHASLKPPSAEGDHNLLFGGTALLLYVSKVSDYVSELDSFSLLLSGVNQRCHGYFILILVLACSV